MKLQCAMSKLAISGYSLNSSLCKTWPRGYKTFSRSAQLSMKFQLLINTEIAQTRIVRGSDYRPASELFSRVRKTLTGNNPMLDLVKVDARKKIGKKILSGNEILTSIKGRYSVKIL